MYFGRNAYDPSAVSEAQSRLQSFAGATSISSNQYFGRDEEEAHQGGMAGAAEGILGDGTLSNLEGAAKDAISRLMANPDVQNAAESIRAGALKVCFAALLRSDLALNVGVIRSSRITLRRCQSGRSSSVAAALIRSAPRPIRICTI